MKLEKDQIERANKLLELLCKSKSLNNNEVDSFLNNNSVDAIFICKELEKKNLIRVIWLDGNKIASLTSNENTCNAFTTDLLIKVYTRQAKSVKKGNCLGTLIY